MEKIKGNKMNNFLTQLGKILIYSGIFILLLLPFPEITSVLWKHISMALILGIFATGLDPLGIG
jgi:hypothetical protein